MRIARRYEFPRKLGLLEALFGSALAGLGVQWVKCWNGVTWKLDLNNACHRWIVFGKYEGGAGIDLARQKLKHGGVYVDSGANIGQWLLYVGGMQGVKVLAFEPVSSERDWLGECVDYQADWSVGIFPYGLGEYSGSAKIQCAGAVSTLNLNWYKGMNLDRETIEIVRLDQALKDFGVDRVTFWKLDVEGAELEALRGADKYLEKQKIENIYFECTPANYRLAIELLQSFGYKVYSHADGEWVEITDQDIESVSDFLAKPA